MAADGANGTVDLRGEFIRGWDNGRGADPGRGLAGWQSDLFKSHVHEISSNRINVAGGSGSDGIIAANGGYSGYQGILANGIASMSGGSGNGAETRPRNVALLACMKL